MEKLSYCKGTSDSSDSCIKISTLLRMDEYTATTMFFFIQKSLKNEFAGIPEPINKPESVCLTSSYYKVHIFNTVSSCKIKCKTTHTLIHRCKQEFLSFTPMAII